MIRSYWVLKSRKADPREQIQEAMRAREAGFRSATTFANRRHAEFTAMELKSKTGVDYAVFEQADMPLPFHF